MFENIISRLRSWMGLQTQTDAVEPADLDDLLEEVELEVDEMEDAAFGENLEFESFGEPPIYQDADDYAENMDEEVDAIFVHEEHEAFLCLREAGVFEATTQTDGRIQIPVDFQEEHGIEHEDEVALEVRYLDTGHILAFTSDVYVDGRIRADAEAQENVEWENGREVSVKVFTVLERVEYDPEEDRIPEQQ